MYENILQQKEAIKYEQKMIDQRNQETETQKQLDEDEAKRTLLNKFDKTQNSMLGERRSTIKDTLKDTEPTNEKKRKLESTDEDRDLQKTVLELKKEREEAAKPKIGSFWVPSVTPNADPSVLTPMKTQVLCTATDKTHSLTIKSLIDVKFQTDDKMKNICPACLKSLTNASKLSGKLECIRRERLTKMKYYSVARLWTRSLQYLC
jgi:nitric oxide synthase-interacting protein